MKTEHNGEYAKSELIDFLQKNRQLSIGTLTPEGDPYISYAPYLFWEEGLLLLLSETAPHTAWLRQTDNPSFLISGSSDNPFAVPRVTVVCRLQMLDPVRRQQAAEAFRRVFDPWAVPLFSMDFSLFWLSLVRGRAIMGFGAAYDFEYTPWSGKRVAGKGHSKS